MRRFFRNRAFTLLEVIAAVSLVAVSFAMWLPSLRAQRAVSQRRVCMNNEKQLALAALNYEFVRKSLPPSGRKVNPADYDGTSFLVQLLPFLERYNLYQRIKPNLSTSLREIADLSEIAAEPMPTLLCPSSPVENRIDPSDSNSPTITSYKVISATTSGMFNVNIGGGGEAIYKDSSVPDGATYIGSKVKIDQITDGTSNTFYLTETLEQYESRWVVGLEAGLYTYNEHMGTPEKYTAGGSNYYAPPGYVANRLGDEASYEVSLTNRNRNFSHPNDAAQRGTLYENKSAWNPGTSGQSSWGPSSKHIFGEVYHAYCDASVRDINEKIDPAVYFFLTTASGRDPVYQVE